MMTNATQCPQTPEALQLDMPVEVVFEKLDDAITLPLFRPASGTTARLASSLTPREEHVLRTRYGNEP